MSFKGNEIDIAHLTEEEAKTYHELFQRLDVNKDGKICIQDLTQAMELRRIPHIPDHAQNLMEKYDTDKDERISFGEFVRYIQDHEKVLRLYFKRIDTNDDGSIDTHEIMESFRKLGVAIDQAEAKHLLQRMDKDGTLKIDWNEWRNYLILSPSGNLRDIIHYWRHASIIDIGENSLVPDDFTETELQTGMWWRHLVAGGGAGAVSRTCTAPLDRLKVLLQVYGSKHKALNISSGFRQMLKEGGVKSLWRGNGMNVIKIAPESAIKFMAYEQIKSWVKGDSLELTVLQRLVSGSAAGAIAQTTIYPMEVMKTRLALRKTGEYSSMADCARSIARNEGLRAFYRGYIPNLLGIIPYAGIDLAVYETLKKMYMIRNKNQDPGIVVLLGCGTASSTCGQLASYPLALVRTRLQAKGGSKETMVGLFAKILREDGPTGLYRGITPNFLKVAPAVSISYAVYEQIRKSLGITMS
ncbi:calcium-binding mitochondrial carrier protein SCaMC-2-like isoform X2 [Babylonia areolata]|uniref:calcium-binding mitochondrial carrier protein SCaMC-2-like isoform X2 n=1 Tax=Babylonia areolata TaxID=304850 RepID=UPI003FD37A0D